MTPQAKKSVHYIDRGKNTIYITGSVTKNDKPLVIVDGKEIKSLKSVNSNNVETVFIFSGKEATNKYGEKGKNGVIEITTKKGKAKE